jgi:organic radical activating enzyme
MFGRNPILKLDHGDGKMLQVVDSSPFYTIQGEGPFVGFPSVFVRLHGCHLACTFCDTEFSDPADPWLTVDQILDRIDMVSPEDLHRKPLVVITGGEPMRQNIFHLCVNLHLAGYEVQIETAGSFWIEGIAAYANIICSPKTGMVHERIRSCAKAFKYVVNADTQFTPEGIPLANTQGRGAVKPLAAPRADCPVYLSPMDEYDADKNRANFAAVREFCLKYGYIAGVQLHKILGVD